MKCLDCPLKYIGQTGRTFANRYKENIHDIKGSNSNSKYSNHILNTGHTYGTPTYPGCHKDRKEGQIFECLRKISDL
jgi:hypothetical protein